MSVVLHEIGHGLGLAHSCGDPGRTFSSCFSLPAEERDAILDAVMSPTLSPGTQRRAPGADDRAGLEALYGPFEAQPPEIVDVTRGCDGLTIGGSGLDSASVFVIEADALAQLVVTERAPEKLVASAPQVDSVVDLLVGDPTRHYAIVHAGEAPTDCEAEVVAEPSGCHHAGSSSSSPLLLLVLGSALLIARRRRSAPSLAAGLCTLAAVFGSPSSAEAYQCSRVAPNRGPSLVWNVRVVPYFVDTALTLDIPNGEQVLASHPAVLRSVE